MKNKKPRHALSCRRAKQSVRWSVERLETVFGSLIKTSEGESSANLPAQNILWYRNKTVHILLSVAPGPGTFRQISVPNTTLSSSIRANFLSNSVPISMGRSRTRLRRRGGDLERTKVSGIGCLSMPKELLSKLCNYSSYLFFFGLSLLIFALSYLHVRKFFK